MHEPGGPAVLPFEEVETPIPVPRRLLIRVSVEGVNVGEIRRRRDSPGNVPRRRAIKLPLSGLLVGYGLHTLLTVGQAAGPRSRRGHWI